MFDFTVYKDNSLTEFEKACATFEKEYPQAKKNDVLIDVDGTVIQSYETDGGETTFYDDYEIGAVYLKSDLDLSRVFYKR